MSYTLGLDIGSTYTKGVILDSAGAIAAHTIKPTGSRLQEAASVDFR